MELYIRQLGDRGLMDSSVVTMMHGVRGFLPAGDGTEAGRAASGRLRLLLTWGSIPSIYYGDEIGMRYLTDLPEREGSKWGPGFNRAGCRTPMQWDGSKPNAGFSGAAREDLYLPQDPEPDRPTVAGQLTRDDSTLNRAHRLIQLRRTTPELRTTSPTQVLADGYPLVYQRGDQQLVVINPAGTTRDVDIPALQGRSAYPLEVSGVSIPDSQVTADAFGYGVFRLARDANAPA